MGRFGNPDEKNGRIKKLPFLDVLEMMLQTHSCEACAKWVQEEKGHLTDMSLKSLTMGMYRYRKEMGLGSRAASKSPVQTDVLLAKLEKRVEARNAMDSLHNIAQERGVAELEFERKTGKRTKMGNAVMAEWRATIMAMHEIDMDLKDGRGGGNTFNTQILNAVEKSYGAEQIEAMKNPTTAVKLLSILSRVRNAGGAQKQSIVEAEVVRK